jgi:ABC-type lipoprotein release transport system permease subunit
MLLRVAWRNLGRNWRRSAVVVAAIAAGLSACVLLVSWSRGMMVQMAENMIRLRLAHLSVLSPDWSQDPAPTRNLPESARPVRAWLAAVPGAHVAARLEGDGLIQSARSSMRVTLVGVEPEAEAEVSSVPGSVVAGGWLPAQASRSAVRELPPIVLGKALAERLKVDPGDKVVVQVPGEGGIGAFRVVGLYSVASSEFERAHAFVDLAQAQRLYAVGDAVTEVAVRLEQPEAAPKLQTELAAALAKTWPGVRVAVMRWQEREPRLAAMLQMMNDVGWIMYVAVFVAMAFGIANVLLMAVHERTREFGVLRALGLRARALLGLIVLESFLLAAVGVALGLGLALPFVLWLGRVGIDLATFSDALRELGVGSRIYLRFGPADATNPIAIAAVTALVAAFWPALRAARLRPAEALRRL